MQYVFIDTSIYEEGQFVGSGTFSIRGEQSQTCLSYAECS